MAFKRISLFDQTIRMCKSLGDPRFCFSSQSYSCLSFFYARFHAFGSYMPIEMNKSLFLVIFVFLDFYDDFDLLKLVEDSSFYLYHFFS